MKHQFLNEDAIGYNMVILGVSFVGATLAAAFLAPIMTYFVNYGNSLVGGSLHISAQTLNTFGFICGIFAMLPIFLIIGFAAKGYLTAVYERENQRGGFV